MQNTFKIDYQGNPAEVEYHKGTESNKYQFTVSLPDGPVQLQCQKDNEGAYRWLNDDGSVSDQNQEIGEAIETYLVQHQITL